MNTEIRDSIANATVTVRATKNSGQGVLVGGGFILTAAHCLKKETMRKFGITLGDAIKHEIKTAAGQILQVTPWAIEPVSDVALLGPMGGQECPEMVKALKTFCLKTKAVPLYLGKLSEEPLPVWIRTHKGGWIHGEVAQYGQCSHRVRIKAREQIEGGTSGGPIVTEDGELVGIVSRSSESWGECFGQIPRPHLTLPAWAVNVIKSRRLYGF